MDSILNPGQGINNLLINFSAQQLNELLVIINGNISSDETVFFYDECDFTNNLIFFLLYVKVENSNKSSSGIKI